MSPAIILASASPRRRELLAYLGIDFTVEASDVAEDMSGNPEPAGLVKELAQAKAYAVARRIVRDQENTACRKDAPAAPPRADGSLTPVLPCLVIGADTVVVCHGKIWGKPQDRADACRMLAALSGCCHQVYTGVSLVLVNQGAPDEFFETEGAFEVSRVYFRKLEPSEIEAYASTGEPMDKAGSYALQGAGATFVERIDGCYSNIIGLPMPLVASMLRRFNYPVLGLP